MIRSMANTARRRRRAPARAGRLPRSSNWRSSTPLACFGADRVQHLWRPGGRHDQLAESPDAARCVAHRRRASPFPDAQSRFEAARGVVDAGVDHFAVAELECRVPIASSASSTRPRGRFGEPSGDRQADDTGADDGAICPVHCIAPAGLSAGQCPFVADAARSGTSTYLRRHRPHGRAAPSTGR